MKKFLFGILGLLFAVPAVAATLPARYTELQYIESTGTQYIDTGLKQQDGDEFGLVYQHTALDNKYRNLFGASSAGQDKTLYISQTSGTSWVGNISISTIPHNTNKHTLSWVTTSSSSQNIVVDGQTYVVSVRITPNPDLNVMVFARNASNGKMIGKVYGYYQKRNGEYLINLVPAKNSSGVIGMYDLVSEQFFTNQGTGEFTAGPEVLIRIATTAYNSARFSPVVTELNDTIATIRDVVTNTINQTKAIADLQATKQTRPNENCPAGKKCLLVEDNDGQPHWYEIIENAYGLPNGYTALEYVESTGTQYINLGKKGNSTHIYKFKFKTLDANKVAWFGYRQKNTVNAGQILSGTYVAASFGFYSKSSEGGVATGDVTTRWDANTNYDITFKPSQKYVQINNTEYTDLVGLTTDEFETLDNIMLFTNSVGGVPNSNKASFQMKYYEETDANGTLLMQLIPAKNSSNVVGMYDTVSGQFFTNSGSGTFVAGPEI